MSDDTNTGTPAEQNPWYHLALKRHESEMPNYFWNGYMRHLMKHTGKLAEADEVKISNYDGTKIRLPTLTPGELEEVLGISGLPTTMVQISFADCIFDKNADFVSFYFPAYVVFRNASFAGDANFMNASFVGATDFGSVNFAGDASFADVVDFSKASFAERANFKNASFAGMADFTDASFAGMAVFSEARFENGAGFTDASFARMAIFIKASFEDLADFTKASFAERANFSSVSFKNTADFKNASFEGLADFKNASFADLADFTDASFAGEADFSASSDTPPHKGSASFAKATFKLAPSFFERQLHEDTDWQDVKWPKPPSSKERAGDDVRRYESLSLMMSRLEKYDDMHTFFCLSMRTKEIRDGYWSIAFLMSRIYGALFDYGWGVERAFSLWFVHILLGFVFIKCQLQSIGVVQSLALSFSNAHSFIGLYSGAQAKLYEAAGDISCFSFIWGVQTVIGLPLLFFLLLTIRNRFRMR